MRRPAAGPGGVPALRRTTGVPHPRHHGRAGHAAHQAGLHRRSPAPRRGVRPAGRRPPGGQRPGRRRRHPHHRPGHREHRPHAGPGRHRALHRAAERAEGRGDLAAAQRDHRTGRAAHRRAGGAGTGPGPQGLAAPRQFDQPRFRRREPHHHLAGARRRPRRRGADQPGPRRQRAARPLHRPRAARHPGRPDQRQARHQRRQLRPDAAARLRPGGARLPGHHPRGAPRHPAARRLADPVPDPRGHARPHRLGPRRARRGPARVPGGRGPGGDGGREADARRRPGGAGPDRARAGGRGRPAVPPRRPRAVRRGRLRRAAAARRPAPGRRRAPPDRRAVRGAGVRRGRALRGGPGLITRGGRRPPGCRCSPSPCGRSRRRR
ncbi:putative Glutamyl-tRNA reductase [Streptomyces misionensis JCM 4497]